MTQREGKVAIVSGASRGIGRAVAERLGRDEGTAVIVNYHRDSEAGGKRKMQNKMQDREATGREKAVRDEGISWKRLPLVALLAALVAAVANALVYFAASGLGFIPQNVLVPTPSGEHPLTLAPVVASSIVGAIGAAIFFALIGLFAPRPVRLFRTVTIVVLVLSFAMPLTIPGAPVAMILSLEVMHVAAWAVIVGLLTTLACQTKPAGA